MRKKKLLFFLIFLKITVKYIFYLPKIQPFSPDTPCHHDPKHSLWCNTTHLAHKDVFHKGEANLFFRGCLWLGTRRWDTTSGSITVLLCDMRKISILGSISKPFPLSGKSHSSILIDVTNRTGWIALGRGCLIIYMSYIGYFNDFLKLHTLFFDSWMNAPLFLSVTPIKPAPGNVVPQTAGVGTMERGLNWSVMRPQPMQQIVCVEAFGQQPWKLLRKISLESKRKYLK